MVFGSEPDDNMVQKADLKQHISKDTPPTFIWHTVEDQLVFIQNSLDFAKALDSHRIPWELHTFHHGQHGLSLATVVSGIVYSRAADRKNIMIRWLYVNLNDNT